jgi:hypothetical protein
MSPMSRRCIPYISIGTIKSQNQIPLGQGRAQPNRLPARSCHLLTSDPPPLSLRKAASNQLNPSNAYLAKKKIGSLNSRFWRSHFLKSLDGVDELKNGSLKLSMVGEGGIEPDGEGVEGSRLCLGDGGRDWIA